MSFLVRYDEYERIGYDGYYLPTEDLSNVVLIYDDIIQYIQDTFNWIPSINPAMNYQKQFGLCNYGITLFDKEGAEVSMEPKPVSTDRETFLRGRQYTDENGMVEFLTIYPGWYPPRTVHIHVKILDDSKELLTTQLFFPQGLTNIINSLPPYNLRRFSPYTNENDIVLRYSHGVQGGWPKFTKIGEGFLKGTLTIGVDYGYRSPLD